MSTPLSRWRHAQFFDGAKECEAHKGRAFGVYSKKGSDAKKEASMAEKFERMTCAAACFKPFFASAFLSNSTEFVYYVVLEMDFR